LIGIFKSKFAKNCSCVLRGEEGGGRREEGGGRREGQEQGEY
jgi:hypothetical protein